MHLLLDFGDLQCALLCKLSKQAALKVKISIDIFDI